MELEIVWSKSAASGYSKILIYLDEKWSEKEVKDFENQVRKFLNTLRKQPYILKESKRKGYRRGPINKHTILTYRLDKKKNQLQLIHLRGAKQKPLK